jgi:hypothetical protein
VVWTARGGDAVVTPGASLYRRRTGEGRLETGIPMADEHVTAGEHRARRRPAPEQPADEGPGSNPVPRSVIIVLAVALVLVAAFCLYSLIVFWPSSDPQAGPTQNVCYFGWQRNLSRDTLFFLVVAFGGALGGLIHTIRSVSWYTGNRNLRWSWMLFNLMLPIVGALAGVVFYVVLRAGLFTTTGESGSANPFGFTAVAIMAGLFSEQAMEKLKQIATELFAPRPQGEDHVEPENIATKEAETTEPPVEKEKG